MWNFFNWQYVYFIWLLEYLIKKVPVSMKWATLSLIKVKSCNVLLRMLLMCIQIFCSCEQGCEDPWLFFKARRGLREKKFGRNWPKMKHKQWKEFITCPLNNSGEIIIFPSFIVVSRGINNSRGLLQLEDYKHGSLNWDDESNGGVCFDEQNFIIWISVKDWLCLIKYKEI